MDSEYQHKDSREVWKDLVAEHALFLAIPSPYLCNPGYESDKVLKVELNKAKPPEVGKNRDQNIHPTDPDIDYQKPTGIKIYQFSIYF